MTDQADPRTSQDKVPGEKIIAASPDEQLPGQPTKIVLGHLDYIREIAEVLFDQTQLLHELNDESRYLLGLAALLEDRASKLDRKKPLKSAQKLVSLEYKDKLNARSRNLLAYLVAAEGGYLKRKDVLKSDLSSVEQRVVLTLAALLNVAEGLDASKSQTTHINRLEVSSDQLWIVIEGPYAQSDGAAAQHQGRLWEKIGYPPINIVEISEVGLAPSLESEGEEELRILPDDSLAEAGRKVMYAQFNAVLAHEEGTRLGDDIEELHDMRVATRRLRAAFDVFSLAFEKKALKKHLSGLRATGRALGSVRDLDVFLEKAQKYIDTLPLEEQHGIDALLAEWHAQRDEARDLMLSYLDSEAYLKFKDDFHAFVLSPGAGVLPLPKGNPQPRLVRELAPALIYERLAAVRAFDSVIPGAALEQMHALRIEFKKLRYTIEYFRDVLGSQAKGIIQELRTMQDHLGDLNDANVACQLLQEFLDRQPKPVEAEDQQHLQQAVQAYLIYNQSERERLYITFPEVWANFNRPEMRKKLAEAISFL